MKKSLFLVFTYLVIQLLSTLLVKGAFLGYQYLHKGLIVSNISVTEAILSLILSIVLMTLFMAWRGFIPLDKESWSLPSPTPSYLFWLIVATFSSIFFLDFVMYYLDSLPDLMEQTFNVILTSFWGIIAVTLLGPFIEELIFRGAITQFLLEKYNPKVAILTSALIFGLIHMNPVQIFGGFLMGLFLGWIYYKTRSLLPVLIIHIVNNSLSVLLGRRYAEVDTLRELFNVNLYWCLVALSILLLLVSIKQLNGATVSPFKMEKDRE